MLVSILGRNAAVDAVAALVNGGASAGYIQIRTGSAPAATTDANTGTLLATLPMNDPAFGASSAGTATAATITSDTNIDATGTAAHFRIFDSNNVCIMQGTVGTSGSDINFNSVSFVAGGTCAISSLLLTLPASC